MPSPLAHSLTGYLICQSISKSDSPLKWRELLLYCVCPMLPDLDFIPGFLTGEPSRFHHGISHSFGFAFGFGLLMSYALLLMKDQKVLRNFLIFFGLYFSHVLLDSLSVDTHSPYGVPALWPITETYYISPILVFSDIQRDTVSARFIKSLFNFHNFLAIFLELTIFLPLVVVLLLLKGKKARIINRVSEGQ